MPGPDLADLIAYARASNGKLILAGDTSQLQAVENGGGMSLLAGALGYARLAEPARFRAAWEQAASLRLRDGDPAVLAHLTGDAERASQLWEDLRAAWSHAWSSNYAVLEFMQGTGLSRFSPVKPQRWVVASFEHHTSPHGLPRPHVHNIVITSLTTGA